MMVNRPLSIPAPDVAYGCSRDLPFAIDAAKLHAQSSQVQSRKWVDRVTPDWVTEIMFRSAEQAEVTQGV